jgi:hypothetical protein
MAAQAGLFIRIRWRLIAIAIALYAVAAIILARTASVDILGPPWP